MYYIGNNDEIWMTYVNAPATVHGNFRSHDRRKQDIKVSL